MENIGRKIKHWSVLVPLFYCSASISGTQGYAIEEVVVTAQKKVENIRDVPISITALGAEFLDDAGVTDVAELSRVAPNLVINSSPYVSYVSMRGLGSGNNKGIERSVALVIDGVYYGRQDYLVESLVDVERIEILRGPQGTLFGKNAIAGALNVTTATPSPEFTGNLSVMGGEQDRKRLRFAAGGPVIEDALNVRLAWDEDSHDGPIYNTTFDQSSAENPDRGNIDQNLRDRNNHVGRISLQAPNLLDGLDLKFTATTSSIFGNSSGVELSEASDATLTVYRRYDPATEAVGNRRTSIGSNEDTVRKGESYSFQFDYEFEYQTLTGILSSSDFDKSDALDGDFGPISAILVANEDSYSQRSAELRIASPGEVIDYVAGLFYFESDFVGKGQTILNASRIAEIVAQDRLGVPATIDSLLGLPPGSFPISTTAQNINNDRFFDQQTKSIALFGQATWYATEKLALMLGLRYSEETKEADMALSHNNAGAALFFNTFLNETGYQESRRRDESDLSPKLSVRYDISDDINFYATWATAFKAGGFNEQSVDNTNLEFEPEEALTWEAGTKMRLLDGAATLNIGLFYTEFDNLQVSMFNGINFTVGNAASAISKGVEIEGQLVPASWLSLGGSIAYLNARYDKYLGGQCVATSEQDTCDLSGAELTRAPEWEITFNPRVSASDLIPSLGEYLPIDLGFGLDMTFRTTQYFSTDLDSSDKQGSHTEINGNMRIAGLNGDWTVLLSAKNITDKLIQLHGGDVPLQPGSHFGTFNTGRRYFVEFQYQW
ncbi:TonB-dependent receptor [Zhongshania aquimaris]|nr:TonB-dependent receptor [Zhongshania aquimaris]